MNGGTLHKYNSQSQTLPCGDKLGQCHRIWTVRAALADEFCRVMSGSSSSAAPEMMKKEGHIPRCDTAHGRLTVLEDVLCHH